MAYFLRSQALLESILKNTGLSKKSHVARCEDEQHLELVVTGVSYVDQANPA